MKNTARILTGVSLAALLAASASAAGFAKTQTYADGTFTDVPADEWYAPEVKNTYELGLMKGIGDGLFTPDGSVTVAEALTMACRAHAINAGEEIPAADGEWYQMYVNYAAANGFGIETDNYDREATRAEVAQSFAKAMPADYYTAKNDVKNIPDVSAAQPFHDDIFKLYKAGVVMGSDLFGNFMPFASITRAEAAAIINRVALPENRLARTLEKQTNDDAYTMVITTGFNASHEGIASGWVLDNRGGLPRQTLSEPYGSLVDVSETAPTALIRELNKTSTGIITLSAGMTMNGDGAYFSFRNDKDADIYRLEIMNGAWNLLTDNGYVKVADIPEGKTVYALRVDLDLDNERATTYLDEQNLGTYALAAKGDDCHVVNFRFATTEKSTAIVAPGRVFVTANYALYDDFTDCTDFSMPFGWTGVNAKETSDKLLVSAGGAASHSFPTVSGKVIASFDVKTGADGKAAYTVSGNGKAVLNFAADAAAGSFTANGVTVYENYVKTLWYRLYFVLDTDTQMITVKVNGRKVAEVPFAALSADIDTVSAANTGSVDIEFNHFRVFREKVHDDYVPVPVVPKGADDYNIGMNVCSLWRNGSTVNASWSTISPYDDEQLSLGYYDEGNPETADWEIKYMVEHGIDFGAYCVFFGSSWGCDGVEADHLFEGFMNAKYSDMSKFAIIWEAANGCSPGNRETWVNGYVPCMIEYFFKDPRYMTIDNKPVLCVFGGSSIASQIGSQEKAKEMFDYLDEEIKKYGFDGMIYLVCGSSSGAAKAMGYDGAYAYNWGTAGYSAEYNKTCIMNSNKDGSVYTVPCVSVGFNSIGWGGERTPLMSKEDYDAAHKWVRDEYLPTYAKETWQKNFVMLSTWNEYGEGTYIMPTREEKGFRYLDTIRNTYTKETENASVDVLPTDDQLYRITHLYPQYRRLLRKQGVEKQQQEETDLEVAYTIDYTKFPNPGDNAWSVKDVTVDANGVTGTVAGDAILMLGYKGGYFDNVSLDDVQRVRITASIPENEQLSFFFTTEEETGWDEAKHVKYPVSTTNDMVVYDVDISKNSHFKGLLRGFRIDPADHNDVTFTVKTVEFMKAKPGRMASDRVIINGGIYQLSFSPEKNEAGDMMMVFEPKTGMDFALNSFHLWDAASKTLTLYFDSHVFTFKVGDKFYTFDGKKTDLSYALGSLDGLPLIPINRVCEQLGYKYSLDDSRRVNIETPEYERIKAAKTESKEGCWEFDTVGDNEGWKSNFMNLLTSSGYMSATSMSDSNDPTIVMSNKVSLPAAKYKELKLRLRYQYGSSKPMQLKIYFGTDKESGLNEAKTIRVNLKDVDSHGEWEEYTVDLTAIDTWKDTIKSLRFDPFDSQGFMDIDYIRFIEDPDYKESASAETKTETKTEEKKPETKTVLNADGLDVLYTIDYSKIEASDKNCWAIDGKEAKADGLHGTSGGVDPIVILSLSDATFMLSDVKAIRVNIMTEEATTAEIYYITDEASSYDQAKHASFTTNAGEEMSYVIDASKLANFKSGALTGFRVDVANRAGVPFVLKSVEFLGGAGSISSTTEEVKPETKTEEKKPAATVDTSAMDVLYTIDYSKIEASDKNCWAIDGKEAKADGLHGTSGGVDPIVILSLSDATFMLSDVKAIRINMTSEVDNTAEIYYTTDEATSYDEAKHARFDMAAGDTEYVIDASKLSNFKSGVLKGFRVDVAQKAGVPFILKSVEFLG